MTNVMRSRELWLSSWGLVILLLLVVSTTLISSIHGDPTNLVFNGNFDYQQFLTLVTWPQMDVLRDGDMNYITGWQCVHGGVQVLSANEYVPDPTYISTNVMHMNYKYGPGVLISSPVSTPRKGASYNLTFSFADNPDGGPMYKTLRVKILVNGEIAEPIIGDFNISSPESQRDTISWVTMGALFVGSGETTTFQFESLIRGSFGPLIDNVQTTLMTVVDNGSFERTESFLVVDNNTWYNVINAPSTIISSWTVVAGSIKRVGGGQWQSSTDYSDFCLELNANETNGMIVSDPFPTVPGYDYVLLYDTAASPEGVPEVYGNIFASAKASVNGEILNTQIVTVNADGFSPSSIGWMTKSLTFKATGTSAVVEFLSKISGSNGPLLDNVNVYQVVPTNKYKSLPLTYNAAETPPRPSMWITLLTAGLCSSSSNTELDSRCGTYEWKRMKRMRQSKLKEIPFPYLNLSILESSDYSFYFPCQGMNNFCKGHESFQFEYKFFEPSYLFL